MEAFQTAITQAVTENIQKELAEFMKTLDEEVRGIVRDEIRKRSK